MRTSKNFFAIMAIVMMALVTVGCNNLTKITAPDQPTDQPGQTGGPATVTFSLPGDDSLQKSASILEIEADFTNGARQTLATSYIVTYWDEHWFVLYKDGVPVYNVLVNGKLVPGTAVSGGKIWFVYQFDPLRILFPGEGNYPGKNSGGLTKVKVSFQHSGLKSAKFRGDFNNWNWVNMTKSSDSTWVSPDSVSILADPTVNKIQFLVSDQTGNERFEPRRAFVNGVLLRKGQVDRNSDNSIKTLDLLFSKNRSTGAILNPGNEDLYAASVNFGG